MKKYFVEHWGSHPDDDNDDCWSGEDYDTLDEARAAFNKAIKEGVGYVTAYIVLGISYGRNEAGVYEIDNLAVVANPDHDPARRQREREASDRAWRREIALEAGMAGGCDAYNEVMGW